MARSSHRPLLIDGIDVPLELTLSPRARRLTLRLDNGSGQVRVVAPPSVPEREVALFVARNADWVRRRLEALPPRRPFAHGATVPYLGLDHRIVHDAGRRRPVERVGGAFVIGGREEHLPRRLTDHLKSEARRELSARAGRMAEEIRRRVSGVTVRDTRSRWGSCSISGRLNFSWRLILAPESVLDYVVAHEVAHLREMNHGERFWSVVDRLHPDKDAARRWLRAQGAGLHRYG